MGYGEAAATLGISVESLRGRHKRIRARLRRRLAER
jgi:DNA-directed RNA polymerase specialized sigma24 family protein